MKRNKSQLPHIDRIPPELCDRREIAKILGLSYNGMDLKKGRYKKLKFAEVVYKNKRILLFNRKQVESLVYTSIPDGYITGKEASLLLDYCVKDPTACTRFLKKEKIPCKFIRLHHSCYVFLRSAVEQLKARREKNGMDKNKHVSAQKS